jgi:hypothetical protein
MRRADEVAKEKTAIQRLYQECQYRLPSYRTLEGDFIGKLFGWEARTQTIMLLAYFIVSGYEVLSCLIYLPLKRYNQLEISHITSSMQRAQNQYIPPRYIGFQTRCLSITLPSLLLLSQVCSHVRSDWFRNETDSELAEDVMGTARARAKHEIGLAVRTPSDL